MSENQALDGLVFDLSGVEEEKGFEVLPKGEYSAIVDEMEFKDSSKGNPMIAITYEIVDNPEYEGRKIYDYWVLSGSGSEFGLAKLKKFLTRVCPEVTQSQFNPYEFCENGVAIGKDVVLKLKVQTQKKGDYAGEKRNTVQDIQAPSIGSFM